jgi:hypothetical protein
MRLKTALLLILMIQVSLPAFAQGAEDSSPSLGEIAKQNASKKAKDPSGKTKWVVSDDDDTALRKSPIPSIALEGPDNIDQILNAIHEYRSKHDQADTEDVVHIWFDQQSEVLSNAIDNIARQQKYNQMKMENAQDHPIYVYNGNHDFDPHKYNEYLTSQRWAQRMDASSAQDNSFVIFRIQEVFLRVRGDVLWRPNKTQPAPYDWFRIRALNGTTY